MPSCARPWWAGAGHGCSEGSPHPGASPPAPRSRSLTLLGPSTASLFHAGSGGRESGAASPGLVGDEVTSSFSISQAGLTSLMERQSLGMEAGGDGAEPGGKPRQTQTHAHARTHAQTGMRAHTHTHAHAHTRTHTHTRVHSRFQEGTGRRQGGGRGWGGAEAPLGAALRPP